MALGTTRSSSRVILNLGASFFFGINQIPDKDMNWRMNG